MIKQLYICGADEVDHYHQLPVTHLIRISNPNDSKTSPPWFRGDYLELQFGDVFSTEDAIACRTRAASIEDIEKAVTFARQAQMLVVTCDYGASRSPAIAAVILADRMGMGRERDAIDEIMAIRPEAVPNEYVVKLGDNYLCRGGSLLKALRESYDFG